MNKSVFVIGFAVFTMFFGAGNVTLPLMLTGSWPDVWFSSFLGFCLSGVALTLLGLMGGVLCRNTDNFFAPLGVVLGISMQLVLVLIEGPFGVVPRSFIVAFGAFKEVVPGISGIYFYSISAVIVYTFAVSRTSFVSLIGKYITPVMLVVLLVIILNVAYTHGGDVFASASKFSSDAFKDGIFKGYLTYDLPGAIYFTTIAMGYLADAGRVSKKAMIVKGLQSCSISAVLLVVVYFSFFYLGATHSGSSAGVPPEQILPIIVSEELGSIFSGIFSIFVFLACMTTALAAITIWSKFIYKNLKLEEKGISYNYVIVPSLCLSVIVSNLNFTGLVAFLSPILSVVYPALVLLTLYNIYKNYKSISLG